MKRTRTPEQPPAVIIGQGSYARHWPNPEDPPAAAGLLSRIRSRARVLRARWRLFTGFYDRFDVETDRGAIRIHDRETHRVRVYPYMFPFDANMSRKAADDE